MSDPISIARKRWFDATPVGKEGVTERYVVFGEARKWLLDRLQLHQDDQVLDFGSGHGFLSFELASRSKPYVIALDILGEDQVKDAVRGAQAAGLKQRISWVLGDGKLSPFPNGVFDTVVSFLALQDVHMVGGVDALSRVLEELCRVLKPGGAILLADNMFLECPHNESEKLYWDIQKQELHAALPSKNVVNSALSKNEIIDLHEQEYDTSIRLDEEEAKTEMMDVVEAKPFGRQLDFPSLWKRYEHGIRQTGLAYPRVLSILGRKNIRAE